MRLRLRGFTGTNRARPVPSEWRRRFGTKRWLMIAIHPWGGAVSRRSAEYVVQAIGPVRMTQPRPHQKIAPVPRQNALHLRNAFNLGLEQDQRGRLQSLEVLARGGLD